MHIISKEVDAGNWTLIKLGRKGSPISHLCFANDFLVFGEASVKQMDIINRCLDSFLICLVRKFQYLKLECWSPRMSILLGLWS